METETFVFLTSLSQAEERPNLELSQLRLPVLDSFVTLDQMHLSPLGAQLSRTIPLRGQWQHSQSMYVSEYGDIFFKNKQVLKVEFLSP